MEAFAKVADLEARWRKLTTEELSRAEVLLDDASTIIATEMNRAGVSYDEPDALLAANLTMVACDVVRRSMLTPVDQPAMAQYSQGAIGFSESVTYVNPSGNLYLSKDDRRRLGISKQRIGSIRPYIKGVSND